jgi:hypothetical protein
MDYWWESKEETDHKKGQDVGGWIILRSIFDWMGWNELDLCGWA